MINVPPPIKLNCWLPGSAPALGFEYQIRYAKRRNAELRIQGGEVKLYAPNHMSPKTIKAWLEQRSGWILDCLQKQQAQLADVPQRQGKDGEHWAFLGRQLQLVITPLPAKRRATIRHDETQLKLALPLGLSTLPVIERWYKRQAQLILSAKTCALADRLGLSVKEVKLRRTKTKWGHCTQKGVIQYNWLIMQAPEWVVDYLVTHEVCHLKHPNHSRDFWAFVASSYPDYQHAEKWLKDNGHTLTV